MKKINQNKVFADWSQEYGALKNKRLLLLGGGAMMKEVVSRAKYLGVYTLVMNWDETDAAKELCDMPICGNARDVNEVAEVCKKEHVDGIITGYVDILLQTYLDSCEITGLPCYLNNELIDIATNKDHYKEFCNEIGIPVPETYDITDITSREQLDAIDYPVFIKPIDASGSRGAYICNSEKELIDNWGKALKWSPSKTIAVEEYLTGQDIIVNYVVKDGVPHCIALFDRYVTEDRCPPVNSPNLQLAPSHSLDTFMREIDPKVKIMCQKLNVKDGIIFFQGYDNNGKIKLFEMGCRLGASFFSIEEAFTGVNPVDALIHYAITGTMADYGDYDKVSANYDGIGCVIYYLLKKDVNKMGHIIGAESICDIPGVLRVNVHKREGEHIDWNRVSDVRVITVYLATPDKESMYKAVNAVYNTVKLIDDEGNSMLAPVCEIGEFLGGY